MVVGFVVFGGLVWKAGWNFFEEVGEMSGRDFGASLEGDIRFNEFERCVHLIFCGCK
jgi:hypothetical protein